MNIKPCIIEDEGARRDNARRRSFSMSERSGVALTCPITDEQIYAVIVWAHVERSARWQPAGGATYCNVYAHDVLRELGVHLPRTWWKDPASVTPETAPSYGENCREMSANSLVGWMREWGSSFGWEILDGPPSLEDLDDGDVAVVIGRKAAGHGHVQLLYRGPTGQLLAAQAGSRNFSARVPYMEGFWRGYADVVWAVKRARAIGGANVG